MAFHLVDRASWEREEYFQHYFHQVRCTYSMTADLDITQLLRGLCKQGGKLYPAVIYLSARVINAHREFRYSMDGAGQLGWWDELHPSYTVFHQQDETFSNLWTPYSQQFNDFYSAWQTDMERYGDCRGFSPKPGEPANTFPVSCIPWCGFTGFNLNLYSEGTYLTPILTFGKFREDQGRVLMPLSLQVHHAVCDGFHTSRFFTELQQLCSDFFQAVIL